MFDDVCHDVNPKFALTLLEKELNYCNLVLEVQTYQSFTNITVNSATLIPNFVIVALFIATRSSCMKIQSSKVILIFLPLTGTSNTYSNLKAGPYEYPLAVPTTSEAVPS